MYVVVMMQTYLLKLGTSGKDGEKVLLVLDSGTRFHTTKVGVSIMRCTITGQQAYCAGVKASDHTRTQYPKV